MCETTDITVEINSHVCYQVYMDACHLIIEYYLLPVVQCMVWEKWFRKTTTSMNSLGLFYSIEESKLEYCLAKKEKKKSFQ